MARRLCLRGARCHQQDDFRMLLKA